MDKDKNKSGASAATESPVAEPESDNNPAATEAADPVSAGASDLKAELQKAVTEREELRDLLQRSRAEFENYRRRVEREKLELADYGASQAYRSVIGLLDDLERALKTESSDKEWARGVEMIHQRFTETLKKDGVEPMNCEGVKFDPNVHFAVDRSPSQDVEEDTILNVYQKGYTFKGKLLRPAMVKVAVKE